MGSIIMVSPNYLEASYKEATKYDFTLQGYGSPNLASKGLLKVNSSAILGFVYLADKLPEDIVSFEEFLYRCNLISNGKKFLFALLNWSNLGNLDLSKYDNLNFKLFKIDEVVTDTVINRYVFGSILLANYEPYIFNPTENMSLPSFGTYTLQYKAIFSELVLQCLHRVNLCNTYEETIEQDEVYHHYCNINSDLANFRAFYIKTFFYNYVDMGVLNSIVESKINEESYSEYRALLHLLNDKHNIS